MRVLAVFDDTARPLGTPPATGARGGFRWASGRLTGALWRAAAVVLVGVCGTLLLGGVFPAVGVFVTAFLLHIYSGEYFNPNRSG